MAGALAVRKQGVPAPAAPAREQRALADWEPRKRVAADRGTPAAPAEVAGRHSPVAAGNRVAIGNQVIIGNQVAAGNQAAVDSRGATDIPAAAGANLEVQGYLAAARLAKAPSREDRRPLAEAKVPESKSNLQERTEGLSCDSVCR